MIPPTYYLIWSLFWLLIATGIVGALLPIPLLPGTPLIVLAALTHHYGFPDTTPVSWPLILTLTALTLITLILDTLTSALGAKKFGGTRWSTLGAIAGALLGLLLGGPVGLLIGPALGVFSAELIALSDPSKAWRATQGALLGMLLGTIGRAAITIGMIALLLWQVLH
jgi:uncharacterized protein YqgC (DUF456 family)